MLQGRGASARPPLIGRGRKRGIQLRTFLLIYSQPPPRPDILSLSHVCRVLSASLMKKNKKKEVGDKISATRLFFRGSRGPAWI